MTEDDATSLHIRSLVLGQGDASEEIRQSGADEDDLEKGFGILLPNHPCLCPPRDVGEQKD